MRGITTCVKVLSFSLEAGPGALPPLVCHLFNNDLFEVSSNLHQTLLRLSQATYWLLVHTFPHADRNL